MLAVWWLLIGWTLVECRPLLRVWWRWLCCRTGHHRYTVACGRYHFGAMLGPGEVDHLWLMCVDCRQTVTLAAGIVRTPSRRYALRGKA